MPADPSVFHYRVAVFQLDSTCFASSRDNATPAIASFHFSLFTITWARNSPRSFCAEVTRNSRASQVYADELKKAVCDVGGWASCIETYLKFKAGAGNWPYRENVEADFPLIGQTLGIVGDWGTGEHAAASLLTETLA